MANFSNITYSVQKSLFLKGFCNDNIEISFIHFIHDMVTLMNTLYDDIPNVFNFTKKDGKYNIFLIDEKDFFELLSSRLPRTLTNNHIFTNFKENFNSYVDSLYAKGIIYFDRSYLKGKITSISQDFIVKNMTFHNKSLLIFSLLNINISNSSKSIFNRLNKVLKEVFFLLKEIPSPENEKMLRNKISILNGRKPYSFEENNVFSWIIFILEEANTLWLNRLKDILSFKILALISLPLDNLFIIPLLRDDLQGFIFLLDNDFIRSSDIYKISQKDKEYLESINYPENDLLEDKLSLLSLAVIFKSYSLIDYMAGNSVYDSISYPDKENALFYAIYSQNYKIAYFLVDKGIDVNLENVNGKIASEVIINGDAEDKLYDYIEERRKK